MKPAFSIEVGRRILLTAVFILLTAMLVLIYLHPAEEAHDSAPGAYEQETYDRWASQVEVLLKQHEWDKAKNLALKILHSFPDDLFAQRILVRILSEKGQPEKAENICRQIIYKNPEAALSRNNLAVLLYPARKDEAVIEISIALKLMPEHPVIKYNHCKITGTPIPADEEFPEPSEDLLIVTAAPNGEKP